MLYRVQGMVLALLGAGSVVEAWRITAEAREAANFDAIGPDRYLMALGVLMGAIGIWMALRPPVANEDASTPSPPNVGVTFFFTMAMLIALAALLPYLGYPIASLVFLAVMFHRFGGWSWVRSGLVATAVATVFYVAFIRLADVPLPHPYLSF